MQQKTHIKNPFGECVRVSPPVRLMLIPVSLSATLATHCNCKPQFAYAINYNNNNYNYTTDFPLSLRHCSVAFACDNKQAKAVFTFQCVAIVESGALVLMLMHQCAPSGQRMVTGKYVFARCHRSQCCLSQPSHTPLSAPSGPGTKLSHKYLYLFVVQCKTKILTRCKLNHLSFQLVRSST